MRRVCPGWMSDSRDDLIQVAVIRVLEIQRKSEGKKEFSSSYLWRVAYSALVDEIRRRRRRQEVPLVEEERPVISSSRADPEEDCASRELGQGIRECLTRLLQARRLAVTLHLQGHSVPEASRILSWKMKRTENLTYRGLADLRECLGSKGLRPNANGS